MAGAKNTSSLGFHAPAIKSDPSRAANRPSQPERRIGSFSALGYWGIGFWVVVWVWGIGLGYWFGLVCLWPPCLSLLVLNEVSAFLLGAEILSKHIK